MATQASAITFLSTPGQAYHGHGFCAVLLWLTYCNGGYLLLSPFIINIKSIRPMNTLRKFDLKHAHLQLFFLFQEVWEQVLPFMPAIILSAILGWNLNYMTIAIGVLVIIYTFFGGTKR
jgi:Na+/proline symporter